MNVYNFNLFSIAQFLKGVSDLKNRCFVEVFSYDHHSDWKTLGESSIDTQSGVSADIKWTCIFNHTKSILHPICNRFEAKRKHFKEKTTFQDCFAFPFNTDLESIKERLFPF